MGQTGPHQVGQIALGHICRVSLSYESNLVSQIGGVAGLDPSCWYTKFSLHTEKL